jgi:hypothetical protein
MANVKITELTAATALAGTDVLPIVDVGADATKKVSVSDLLRNLPDGTASAPALAFADDQNTGVLSPGNNSLAFATSGTQRLVIDSSGQIGIGTSSPARNCEIAGGASGAETILLQLRSNFTANNTSSVLRFGNSTASDTVTGSSEIVGARGSTGSSLAFRTQSGASLNEALRIDSSGNVGIGTTSPRALVDFGPGSGDGTLSQTLSQYQAVFEAPQGTGDIGRNIAFATTTTGISAAINAADEGGASATGIAFATGTAGSISERLRIDRNGNVGIGTTSPGDYLASAHQLVISDAASTGLTIATPTSSSGTIAFADGTGAADNARGLIRYSHSDNSLQFSTNAAERMRIDSSGNVLVGTTTAAGNMTVNMGTDKNISFNGNQGEVGDVPALVATNNAGSALESMGFRATDLRFATGSAERMRIASNGQLLLNTTSSAYGGTFVTLSSAASTAAISCINSAGSGTMRQIDFFQGASTGRVGSIETTTTATAYNTSSDYRLKENVVDIADGIARVKQLQPKRFNFIADAEKTVDGFLAHEAQTVVPEAVTGTHNEVDDDGNAVIQGIDQSKLVPLLTAALQEAIAKIETLEAKVAALEAQ